MPNPSHNRERRSHRRVLLELPLDYQPIGSSDIHGGIVIDGSETGLFIHSLRDMPLGTQLRVSILFVDEFALANIETLARIVRKIRSDRGRIGYSYGLELVRIDKDEEEIRRFNRFLIDHRAESFGGSSAPSLMVNLGAFSENRLKKEGRTAISILSNLLKIR
jgi:hypothetical protein